MCYTHEKIILKKMYNQLYDKDISQCNVKIKTKLESNSTCNHLLDIPISMVEVQLALIKCKNRKTGGNDQIPNEVIKYN